jgi:hypothetical protein
MSGFDSRLSWLPASGCLYLPVYFCTCPCDVACLCLPCLCFPEAQHRPFLVETATSPILSPKPHHAAYIVFNAYHLACIEFPGAVAGTISTWTRWVTNTQSRSLGSGDESGLAGVGHQWAVGSCDGLWWSWLCVVREAQCARCRGMGRFNGRLV